MHKAHPLCWTNRHLQQVLSQINKRCTAECCMLIVIIRKIRMTMFMVLSSWRGHCENPPGSFGECRLNAGWPPTLKPSQPTWHVSPHAGRLLQFAFIIAIYYYYSAQKLLLIMAALCNRGAIIFLPCSFFLLFIFFFFSSPNLSGHRSDVYHTSTHGVALVRI